MFRCNDNLGKFLDVFIKALPLEPNTTYRLTVDQYGGAFGVWINRAFAVQGHGPYYFDHCETWTTRELCFTITKTPSAKAALENWCISFFKKAHSLYNTGLHDTYIDNVRLCKADEPETTLLVGGDFEAPPGDPLYTSQWEPMILGGIGAQRGITLTGDPLNAGNRCLRLPKVLVTPDYPDHVTLRAEGFGWYKNNSNYYHHRDPVGVSQHLLLLAGQGEIILYSDQSPRTITSGNVIYIPPNTPFHYRCEQGKGTDYYWVMFSGEAADALLKPMQAIVSTPAPLPRFSELTAHIDQMLQFPYDNALYPYAVSAHLQLLLSELSEQLAPKAEDLHKQMINRIAARLREQPEQPIDNTRLAEECGFSVGHFIRLFKQYKGCTPHQYHLRALVQKGCTLLRDTTMTVQEISFALGIENPLYFSRLFRSIQGVPPREYRKSHSM